MKKAIILIAIVVVVTGFSLCGRVSKMPTVVANLAGVEAKKQQVMFIE